MPIDPETTANVLIQYPLAGVIVVLVMIFLWYQREMTKIEREARAAETKAEREARAKDAEAEYQVLEQFDSVALLEVRLVTGKRNQIRYQAGARGHPLVGERLYTFGGVSASTWPACRRQALHAWRLAFDHPRTGRELRVEAQPPADFEALLATVRRGLPVKSAVVHSPATRCPPRRARS